MPRGIYKRKSVEVKEVTKTAIPDKLFLDLIRNFAKFTGLSLFESAKHCIKLIEEKDNE